MTSPQFEWHKINNNILGVNQHLVQKALLVEVDKWAFYVMLLMQQSYLKLKSGSYTDTKILREPANVAFYCEYCGKQLI